MCHNTSTGMGTKYICFSSSFILLLLSETSNVLSLSLSQEVATKVMNETFTVSCKPDPKENVTWTGPKGLIGPATRPSLKTSSHHGVLLLFNRIIPEDAGEYVCKSPTQNKSFTLTVETPLEFMDTPLEQEVQEGSTATIRCEVRGGTITWANADASEIKDSRIKIIGDGLVIYNVTRNDSKNYICKAFQTSTGTIKDRSIRLKVHYVPNFLPLNYTKEEHVYSFINSTKNLTCQVDAEPPVKFIWLTKPRRTFKIKDVDNRIPNLSILKLQITNNSFGQYKCSAANSIGVIEKIFVLEEGIKPYRPRHVLLKKAFSKSLELDISPPNMNKVSMKNMGPIGFEVSYRPVLKNETQSWSRQLFNISKNNEYKLNLLNSSTDYEVKAASMNVAGLGDYTNSSIFRTTSSAVKIYENFTNLILLLLLVSVSIT